MGPEYVPNTPGGPAASDPVVQALEAWHTQDFDGGYPPSIDSTTIPGWVVVAEAGGSDGNEPILYVYRRPALEAWYVALPATPDAEGAEVGVSDWPMPPEAR